MTGTGADARTAALVDLIAVRIPVGLATARLRTLPWDSDDELAVVNRDAAVSVLNRYRSGELTADDLQMWAEAIEGREDIGFEPGHEATLSRFTFETANPTLAEALTDRYAISWIDQLTSS